MKAPVSLSIWISSPEGRSCTEITNNSSLPHMKNNFRCSCVHDNPQVLTNYSTGSSVSKCMLFTSKQKKTWGWKMQCWEESHFIWLAARTLCLGALRLGRVINFDSLPRKQIGEKWIVCTHKETLNDGVYEIHYGCSRFLPPAPEKEPSLCCLRTGTTVRVAGPGVILIKRIFISVLLICMAEAIGEREGRNERGENEWIKLERPGMGYETVMQ